MSTHVWKKIGSPELTPSLMTLHAYDGQPSQPQALLQNVPLELGGKVVLVDIKVVNTQLDYNILLSHSYIYTMLKVASTIFQLMMFPYNGKVVTIDNLMCCDSKSSYALDNVLATTEGSLSMPSFSIVGPGVYDSSLIDSLFRPPPIVSLEDTSQLCTITNGVGPSTPPETPHATPQVVVNLCINSHVAHNPFLFNPPKVVRTLIMGPLNLHGLTISLPVWYINPPHPALAHQVVLTPIQLV